MLVRCSMVRMDVDSSGCFYGVNGNPVFTRLIQRDVFVGARDQRYW